MPPDVTLPAVAQRNPLSYPPPPYVQNIPTTAASPPPAYHMSEYGPGGRVGRPPPLGAIMQMSQDRDELARRAAFAAGGRRVSAVAEDVCAGSYTSYALIKKSNSLRNAPIATATNLAMLRNTRLLDEIEQSDNVSDEEDDVSSGLSGTCAL